MGSQTVIFRQQARDFMRPVELSLPPETPASEVVGRMAATRASSVVVTGADRGVLGILTEQDVIRRVAFQATPETPVGQLMSRPVMLIAEDDHLYRAIARMRRQGLRHMPVVDGEGALVGMLDLHDALAVASAQTMERIDLLTHEGTLDGVREVKAAQVDLAEDLFADSVPAPEIQALITHVNNDIYRRLVEASLEAMDEDGWGAPPVEFAVIVMGSGGRGENYLYPDQDNGFILEDYPDADHDRIDHFFVELAERMNRDLDAVGFPLCRGHVMARNPLWRKTLSQWREQVNSWNRRRDHVALRLVDIFFDFTAVFGRADMARDLRRHVMALVTGNAAFLKEMYRDDEEAAVALGLFGRLLTEREDKAHRGELNLKHTGTLPLVEGVRLMALGQGVEATSTLARIEALGAAGVLDRDEQDYLAGGLTLITRLLLRQQIADFKAGRAVGIHVPPRSLSRRERDMLVNAFKAIKALRARIRSDLTGEVF